MNSILSGLEKLSLVDFDSKVACTLFTYGCNFRCPFCHNAHLFENAEVLDWDEIYKYLKKRVGILDAVVITGGEPTIHEELVEFIKQIKDLGYIVKLDTNGTNPSVLKYLIENSLIDYVAMDIKSGTNNYNAISGAKVDMTKIKESINILKTSNIKYEFRCTLVNEFHDEEVMESLGKLIEGSNVLYLQKFILRETCPNQHLTEVNIEKAKKFKKILEKYITNVFLREYE